MVTHAYNTVHLLGGEGSFTGIPPATYSEGRVLLKAASATATAYVWATIDTGALGC